jgi:hypothetical protein
LKKTKRLHDKQNTSKPAIAKEKPRKNDVCQIPLLTAVAGNMLLSLDSKTVNSAMSLPPTPSLKFLI